MSIVASASSNSSASKGVTAPRHRQRFFRCRSPWQRRTRPAASRAASAGARSASAVAPRPPSPHPAGGQPGREGRAARAVQRRRHRRGRVHARHRLQRRVGGGGRVGDPVEEFRRQPAARRDRVEEVRRGHRRHAQHPFHGIAIAVELQRPVRRPRDRDHVPVEVRGEAAVDRQLVPGEALAGLRRGEVQEAQIDRLFQLQRRVRPDEHRRDARLDRRGAAARRRSSEAAGRCAGGIKARRRPGSRRCHG